ncbi:hypothetical protein IV203_000706 [Nitzschia inconspicua]|uniref:PTM/DIR17-like Tudor domain-containing protein n=1 Tax=Nitzschia inconspicua TaxID=303405 RepID=A0A9K3PQ82_9STRA|nr:hypothetical protein IV203_000706 [Nitzschia inconspicua]
MATKRQQRWPLGTKIRKYFEGHGEFIGEVQSYKDGLYTVLYSDGDTEELDGREMKRFELQDPSLLLSTMDPPTSRVARIPPAAAAAKPAASKRPQQDDVPSDHDEENAYDDYEDDGSGVMDGDNTEEDDDDDDDDDDEEEDGDNAVDAAAEAEKQRRERVMRDIESMHQELEVTGYGRSKSGHRRKVVPRHESKIRTKKRKMLERLDRTELAVMGEEDDDENEEEDSDRDDDHSVEDGKGKWHRTRKKRLRGSKAALEDDVLQDSMVFQPPSATARKVKESRNQGDDDDDDDDEEEGEDLDDEEEFGSDDGDDGPAIAGKKIAKQLKKKDNAAKKKTSPPKKRNTTTTKSQAVKKRRRMYRLRNFESFKMAQRHGDALAAHARGDHKTAIEKLKAVAKDAPSAPQVYSSLGMVYEDMLKESKHRYYDRKASGDSAATALEEGIGTNPSTAEASSTADAPFIPNQFLREQCDLAKKAYGSHHVSAILCKKDFTLWVRAGESALEIAGVHEELLSMPGLHEDLRLLHKAEKRRWQDEALRDILVADNLKPPGIEVPAKLAATHLELGNLSDCLTILTDLKNRSAAEFHSSCKAWILYSDLMLRLGHECIQWNQGIQTNENYMVRRWLRKYSKSFDWQERRVQALALALEAAAGTSSTEEFVSWLRNRTMEIGKVEEDEDANVNGGATNTISTSNPQNGANDDNARSDRLAEEKGILSRKQEKEIKEFDQTTADMELVPDSDPSKDRESARKSLLESHKNAIGTLEREFDQQDQPPSNDTDQPSKLVQEDKTLLPISASVRVVCKIAGDLMKQLHGLQLYKGARLVGEAVARYMKERARRADRNINFKKRAEEWQQKVDKSPFFLDSYEEGDIEEDDEDQLPYLSDEEALVDVVEQTGLLESLRRGVLPPELRVLLALAMIGEGGRNFVASKYLEAIHQLDQETETWFSDGDKETDLSGEPGWFLFKRAMGETVTKTIAFAFLADVLKKTDKEAEWAVHFSPWFLRHIKALDQVGIIDQLLVANRSKLTPNRSIRKNQVLKVMLASCRLAMDTVEEREGVVLVMGGKRPDMDFATRLEIARTILGHLTKIVPLIWRVDRNGGLSHDCVEVVRLSSKCIKWLSENLPQEKSVVEDVLSNVQTVVSFYVGGNPIPDLEWMEERDGIKPLLEAVRFPLSKTWQPAEFRPLSDRTYNMAASCNVPPFSGWENEKFSTRLLRRRCRNSDYWLNVAGKTITGCFPAEIENEIHHQLDLLEKLEPEIPKSKFVDKLKLVKESHWYKEKLHVEGGDPDLSMIAQFGEEDVLLLFLSFSNMCLQVAEIDDYKKIARRREQLALSVLVPLCHFCLDETLWDATQTSKSKRIEETLGTVTKPLIEILPNEGKRRIKPNPKSSCHEPDAENSNVFEDEDRKEHSDKEDCNEKGSKGQDADEFEEWRKEIGETIFEPILHEFQQTWDNNETRVLDGPAAIADEVLPAPAPTDSRRRISKPAPKKPERRDVTDTATLNSFVPVPIEVLKKLWSRSSEFQKLPVEGSKNKVSRQMREVHKLMVDLRSCFTLSAAEKICLNISVALLDLAANPFCSDPFSCLQQAAMYAGQASKAGNSDVPFRRSIPKVEDCTPLDALIILGRADCLHSVFFPREAAFLCSFVARKCALQRDSLVSELQWNDQWRVVGMYAHNVRVMIRTTVQCMIHHSNHSRQVDLSSMWETSVEKELDRARIDAVDVLKMPIDELGDGGSDFEEGNFERVRHAAPDRDGNAVDTKESGTPSLDDRQSPSGLPYDPEQLQNRIFKIMASSKDESNAIEVDEEDDGMYEIVV